MLKKKLYILIWKYSSVNIIYKFFKKKLIKIPNFPAKFLVIIQLIIVIFDEIIFDLITKFKFSKITSEESKDQSGLQRSTLKKQIKDLSEYVKNNFKNLENDCFLDIGCGYGKVLYFMKNLNFQRVYGLEIDSSVYKKVKNNFISNHNISIHNENFFKYEIPKNIKFFFLFSPFKNDNDYLKLIDILINHSKNNNNKIYILLSNNRSKDFFLDKNFNLEFAKSYLGKSYNSYVLSYETFI